MDFVENHGFNRAQSVARVGSEEEVERLRSGDENVGRMAEEAGAFGGRGVACADSDDRWMVFDPQVLRRVGDANQRRLKITVDVDSERFDRRNIEDTATMRLGWNGRKHQPVDRPKKRGKRLASAGRSEDQCRFAARDGWPAEQLRARRSGKDRFKPAAYRRVKKREAFAVGW